MPIPTPAGEPLRFQVFGGPQLFRRGELVGLSPLQATMLGLLLGASSGHLAREEVLDLLWPRAAAPRARRRLNQLLYSLKTRTGEPFLFLTGGDRIQRPGNVVRTDLDEFEEAIEDNRLLTSLSHLEQGFLSQIEAGARRSLSDWICAREAELRMRLRRRAERVWIESERDSEWPRAAMAATVLLSLLPGNEGHLRRLMEARGKAGFRLEAEEAFRVFQSHMEEECHCPWTPEPETAELLTRIRAVDSNFANSQTPRILDPGDDDPPLAGREEERSTLRRALRRIPHHSARAIFLLGEAGIGKTRLIREALQGIHLEGHYVLAANAAELERLIPLNPLIEAFSALHVGSVLRDLDEPWRTVLYGVMPSHYPGGGPIPEPPQIQPGSVPRRLFEAIHQLLLRLVHEGPLVLVLEDLQWADQTTLSVLEFLLRRWDRGGLQIVISLRSEEIHRNPTLVPFLETLRSHNDILEVPLGELDAPTSEGLIRGIARNPLSPDDITYLHSLAGGNPFFLIELTLEFGAGRVEPETGTREPIQIPLSIRQVLRRRLAQLSPDAERILGSLAVYGRPLGMEGIAKIARLTMSRCLAGTNQLNELRLVASRGIHVFVRHELIRQTVYESLSEPTRAWFHGRVGRYLLKARERPPVDELAVHFDRAGMPQEAREFGLEAATRAETSGAIPEALRFLRIAREHTQNPEEVAELIGRMGHLHYLHQNLEEAAPLLELAVGRFRKFGRFPEALGWEVERLDCLAQTGHLPWRDCLDELGHVKREARSLGDWSVFAKALDVQIHQHDHRGDLDGARRVLEEAQGCADLGGPSARCKARAVLALHLYYGSPRVALSAARDAVAISDETNDNDLQLHALNRLIVVLLYQGLLDTPEGVEALSKAEHRSRHTGDLILKFFVRQNRAVWHLEIGELPQAIAVFEAVDSVLGGTRARNAKTLLLLNMGEAFLALREVSLARAKFTAAEELLDAASPEAFRTIISAGQGLCALHAGELAEARRRETNLPPFPAYWAFDPSVVVSFKSRMLLRRGDLTAADSLLASVAEGIRERLVTAWLKLVIERCRMRTRVNLGATQMIGGPALEVAQSLGLNERTRQLRELVD